MLKFLEDDRLKYLSVRQQERGRELISRANNRHVTLLWLASLFLYVSSFWNVAVFHLVLGVVLLALGFLSLRMANRGHKYSPSPVVKWVIAWGIWAFSMMQIALTAWCYLSTGKWY